MRGESLQKLALRSKGFVKNNASTILTCAAVTGVITTSVLTAKASTKASHILKEAREEKGEDLTAFETVNVALPVYLPAILSGAATVTCIIGANVINKRKQASLISAYGVLDNSYKEYKKKVEELYGEGADKHVREEIAKEKYTGKEKRPASDDAVLFFDEYSNRYFWSTLQDVKDAEYHFNRNFALRTYAELNEFYEFLGLEPTAFGAENGWSMEAGEQWYGYSWVDFYHEYHESNDPDVPSYYTIEMPFGPTPDFLAYY